MTGGGPGHLLSAKLAGALAPPDSLATAAHPDLLLPFAAIVALLVVAWAAARRRARERMARLVGAGAVRLRSPGPEGMELLALAAVLAALLGPAVGTREETVSSRGSDLVLLFDASASMLARDVPPSRLDRARALADALLRTLGPGDRAALAAFSGGAALLTPLTPDREVLRELLPGIDTDLIAPQGSNLAEGLRVALTAFDADSARPRVVLLLSDGEDPERRAPPLAALRRAGVVVIAVGIGGDRPAPIPRGAGGAGVLLDERGHVVRTRRDAVALEALASATGGHLFLADRLGRLDEGELRAAIGGAAGGPLDEGERTRRVPAQRSAELATLAFLLLLLEAAGRGGAPGRRAGVAAGATVALLLAAVPGQGSPGAARPVPDARALVEAGLARARDGDLEGARRALAAAAVTATDPGLAALAYYDLGVLSLEARDLESARDAFLDALALDENDLAARFNLEWALEGLARAQPPPRRRPGEGPADLPGAGSPPEEEPASGGGAGPPPPEASPPESPAQRPGSSPAAGAPEAPATEATSGGVSGAPAPLDPAEVERVLRQVREDPRAGLRALAGLAGEGAGTPGSRSGRGRHPW